MFKDPIKIWNLDETAVNAAYASRARVFSCVRSNLGGRRHNNKDSGNHVSAVISASDSGFFAPLCFMAAGKEAMLSWKKAH